MFTANKRTLRITLLVIFFFFVVVTARSQDGSAGLQRATEMIRNYFKYGADLMYAVGGLVGLVGAVKVYNKWNSGDHDTGRTAAAWFGSCIFLVVVATVLRSFFNIPG